MHNDIHAAVLTIKLGSCFHQFPSHELDSRDASALIELRRFVLETLEKRGAVRTKLILDYVQALFRTENRVVTQVFGSAMAAIQEVQEKLHALKCDPDDGFLWGGFATGSVVFDDEIRFGDAVTASVFFAEAAYEARALMVVSSAVVPKEAIEYRLSKVRGLEVKIIGRTEG